LGDAVPVRGVMARLTGCGEAALVRIRMAPRAFGEGKARVLYVWFRIGDRRMTLGARSLFVGSGERVLGLGVAKERSWLPSVHGVATCAIFPNLAAVFVLMAGCAFTGESEVSPTEVFDEDPSASSGRNEVRFVAVRASDAGMFSRESEAGLAMVQRLAAWFPVNELKFGAIVL
jgi:hypothetical protein